MKLDNCAILVPTRNRPGIFRESLGKLREIGLGEMPMWVYDDASEDPAAVAAVVRALWPHATLIAAERQQGQAYGRNVLLKACGFPYAVMLDDDQYFLRLGALADYLGAEGAGTQFAGVAFQNRVKSDGRLDVPDWMPACRTPFFMGGAVLFNVGAVLSVGGFRDYWGYGYEEQELAARLYAKGYDFWYDPSIRIEHNHIMTAEAGRNQVQADFLNTRNALLLATLNMPLWLALPMGLTRSVRRSFEFNRNWGAKLRGLAQGLAMTFTHWRDRTPMTARQALWWSRFSRTWHKPSSARLAEHS